MTQTPATGRRHGKAEDITDDDLDPHLTMPSDAIIGAYSDSEVVFVGPVGVGKTTGVATISTVTPINTEAHANASDDFIAQTKTTTTVGIDFGVWDRADTTRVAVFGTAGQDQFDDARTPARNPAAALVVWLFGLPQLLEQQVVHWLETIGSLDAYHRTTFAVNFIDPDGPDPLPILRDFLSTAGHSDIPVVAADPRVHDDVARVIDLALTRLEDYL
ncbi:hypothetical protein [Corynebacterium hadale]|uniref:hypothetical protein n=1 Tax=Corynebacterium hadale TaxID=2026255 RepID=UPI000BAA8896|nr:hypothetical protein [Corynebacterium hadale]PAT08392.1 hypothetical protein CKJ82_05695 [Corynebacterium hadale]